MTYERSTHLIAAIERKPVRAKGKNSPPVIVTNVLGMVAHDYREGLPAGWKSGKSEIFFQPICIGWSRDGGKTVITNYDLLMKYPATTRWHLAQEFKEQA